MGVLEKAAQAKSDSEGKDSRDKRETHKEEMPKKHKHPAPKPAAQPSESADADQGSQGGTEDSSPDAQDDNAPDQDDSGGAGAVSEQPQQPADDESQGGGADQGGGDADQSQGGAQGGPAPVPSPAAPGAGDTTSGGEDTPAQGQDQDPNAQPPQTPAEDTASGPGANSDLKQLPMTKGLQDAYDQANALLMQLLYKAGDDKLAQGLVQGLMPQGPGKIQNAVMLSIQVVVQMHKRMNLPAQIILPFAKDVVTHVLDLGQQVKQIQYSDQECSAILGAVYEGMLRVFGVTKGQTKAVANHFGKAKLQEHQQKYLAMHAQAKPAVDAAKAQLHHPQLAEGQGAPQQPGPQSGAPAGAAPQPAQQGAAPQPPVPPGPPSQGGMLSQAAAAQNPAGGPQQ